MKNSLFLFNKELLFLIIFYTIINKANSFIDFTYPNSLYLSDGNIFVIHKFGITICNSNFTDIIKNVIVFDNDEIITEEKLSKITSVYENGYIFNVINDKIYIFDDIGNLLFKNNTKIIESNENPDYYTLTPIKISNEYYYYVIGFIYNNINLLYYKYNIKNKLNSLIFTLKNFNKSIYINNSINIEGMSLTCQFMKNETGIVEALICFFLTNYIHNNSYNYYMSTNFFVVNENKIEDIQSKYLLFNFGIIKYIKSTINFDHSKAYVCFVLENGETNCFLFVINLNTIYFHIKISPETCLINYYGMKINYYNEKDEYILSCIGNITGNIEKYFLVSIINNEFKMIYKKLKFYGFEYIYGHSILYSKKLNNYYIISDLQFNGTKYPLQKIFLEENNDEEENVKEEENLEEEKINKDLPFSIITDIPSIIQKCNYFYNKTCYSNYNTNKEIYSVLMEEVIGDYSTDDKNIIIEGKNGYIFEITTTINEKNILNGINKNELNLSIIDLGECERLLEDKYDIDENNNTLILFKFEKLTNISSQKNVQYEILDPINKNKLDLNVCFNTTIDIYIPVEIDKNNLFKYNSSSEYYNDICSPYTTEDNTDIILKDRIDEYFNKNLSLCEDGCNYNLDKDYVKCECKVKKMYDLIEDIKIDKNKLLSKFTDLEKYTNIYIFKCCKQLFCKDGIVNNVGSYILLIIKLLDIILSIVFTIKDIEYLSIMYMK